MSSGTLNFANYTAAPGSSLLVPLSMEDVSGTGAGPWFARTQLAGTTTTEIARIKNSAPASTDHGLVTRAMLFDATGSPMSLPQATYAGNTRLAARPYALSATLVANTRKQFASLHHAATATKTLRLRRVLIALESVSVAGIYVVDLVKITTAPATGNPAITPTPVGLNDPAAEATILALPTTAGTEGALLSHVEYNLGVTGAVPTTNPPASVPWVELYSEDEQNPVGEQKAPAVAAGVLGGYAVVVDPSAAGVLKMFVKFVFTEA